MNEKRIIALAKKVTVSILVVGMIVAGIVVYPGQADAAVVEDKVIYEELSTTNYWSEEKKTAPVKEGYVFGGWFEQVDVKTNATETYTDNGIETYYSPLTTVSGNAYAKFVPAQVLSVKAQNEGKVTKDYIANFQNEQDSFYIRVMSSLDSANYQKVGFDIWLANAIPVLRKAEGATEATEPLETNIIYGGVKEGTETKTAQQIFGGVSQYVSVWQLSEINYKENVSLIIYVRPYWITTDGTKVNGLAKYVHIEDQYLEYINVPVNLLGGEKVAAGSIDVSYSNTAGSLEPVAFEEGRIFKDMKCNYVDNTVKMVGVTDLAVGNYQEDNETLYANLRFKKPAGDVEFNISDGEETFCDWDGNYVDVKKVWDTKYVQTTAN